MGSYVFKWGRPANEVYVTGTFDDWSKSVKLDPKNGTFEKKVAIKDTSKKIYYKFVVDGNWTTNGNEPQETDESNNINNVLKPEQIEKPGAMTGGIAGATISGITPDSTTAQLASKVPKESDKNAPPSSEVPGGFPETPQQEPQDFSVKPIPASSGVGNPVTLKPGEKVPDPSEFSTNDVTTADTLDKESYEKAGDGPSSLGAAANPTIQSAGAGTTTAALAAQVPKEVKREAAILPDSGTTGIPIAPTVPDVVQESLADSKVSPEAAASQEAVQEKAQVESELLKEVKSTDAKGEPAPSASAATAEQAPAPTDAGAVSSQSNALAAPKAVDNVKDTVKTKEPDSRDVSPLSHPKTQKQPTVTTGAATAATASKSEATPSSPASKTSAAPSTDKKAKRGSIFGKLKEKFKHKDEK